MTSCYGNKQRDTPKSHISGCKAIHQALQRIVPCAIRIYEHRWLKPHGRSSTNCLPSKQGKNHSFPLMMSWAREFSSHCPRVCCLASLDLLQQARQSLLQGRGLLPRGMELIIPLTSEPSQTSDASNFDVHRQQQRKQARRPSDCTWATSPSTPLRANSSPSSTAS